MNQVTPSYFGPLGDESDFQLPLPGLFADLETGSASIALTDEFLELPPRTRLGMLNQWLRAFASQRDASLVEMFRELAAAWRELTIVQQIDQFRSHCASEGITCPTDFAVLLQRY
ncbi:MAG: hypothetical protein M3Z16_10580 [Pseudomonadota bacterium]|nr:hypothetical protein [Pseudomonadota bacterium]